MAEGLGVGGAFEGGLESGAKTGLALNEQQFEQQYKQKELGLKQQELGIRQDEETRSKAKAAFETIQDQKAELGRQLNQAYLSRDPAQLNPLRQRMDSLHSAEHTALQILVGPQLKDYYDTTQSLVGDLEAEKKKWSELTPEQATNILSFASHGKGLPSDWIDTEGHASPIGKKLKNFDNAVALLSKDGGASFIAASNDIYKGEFEGLIGQHADDGSTIQSVELTSPVPSKAGGGVMMPALKLTTSINGKTGTQVIPLMVQNGKLVPAPGADSQGTVSSLHIADLFDHVNTMKALYAAINSDPAIKDKAMQGYLNGHEDVAQSMHDMMHMMGTDPSQYLPKHQLVFPPHGGAPIELAPNIEAKGIPDYGDLGQAALVRANAALEAAGAKGQAANKGTVVGTTEIDGKTFVVTTNAEGTQARLVPIAGAAGPQAPAAGLPSPIQKPGTPKTPKQNKVVPEKDEKGKPTGRNLEIYTGPDGKEYQRVIKAGETPGNLSKEELEKKAEKYGF